MGSPRRRGAGFLEYGLIAALVAMLSIGVVVVFGSRLAGPLHPAQATLSGGAVTGRR